MQPRLCISFACLLLCSANLFACNVPVFRYALERWQPDPFEVVIFHRGPLNPADRALVARLDNHSRGENCTPVNLDVTLVNVDQEMTREQTYLYHTQHQRFPLGLRGDPPPLPWMVVRFPVVSRSDSIIWAGRPEEKAVNSLLDSPMRREIVKRLVAGETAVWILLESGNETADEAAAKVLSERLTKLKTLLKLPERTDSPADRINEDGPPLRIAFSMIRLSRRNPDEQILLQMLLHSEDELAERTDPMAFPIFGRGRALWALAGKGIDNDTIDESGTFLVGPCSCQVKRMNPGIDLLMMADWDGLIEKSRVIKTPEPPTLTGLSFEEPLSVPPHIETTSADTPARPYLLADDRRPEPPPASKSSWILVRNIGLGALVGVVILGAYALVLRRTTH